MKARGVKKKLALLLCAAMVLTSMPLTTFSALAETAGWVLNTLTVSPTTVEVEVGKTATFTVEAVATATPSVASQQDADKLATASANNAVSVKAADEKIATAKITEKTDTSVTVTVRGVADGQTTVEVTCGDKTEKVSVIVKPATAEPAKITSIELSPSNVSMKLGDTAEIVATAKFNRDDLTDAEKKEQLDRVNAKFTDENVVNLGWAKLDDGWVLRVTGISVGTTSVDVTYKEKVMATGKITVEPKADPEKITMDLDKEEIQKNVSIDIALLGEGKLTDGQADAIWKNVRDWGKDVKVEVSKDGETEVAVLDGIMFIKSSEKIYFDVSLIGKAAGKAALKFTYKDFVPVEIPITVTGEITEPTVKPDVVSVGTYIDYDKEAEELAPDATEEERSAILDQIFAIEGTFFRPVEFEISQTAVNTLKAFAEDAALIEVKPFVQIEGMDLDLNDDKEVIVKGLSTDLHIDVYIDGSYSDEAVKELKKNNVYFNISVPVPEAKVRSGGNYVQWTHYDDADKTKLNNSVIADTVTAISSDDIATVSARAFSPFDLKFVANDNDTYVPSYSGGSSSTKTTSVGQWKKAADGVRWWYENPDGTWPANGWAQLVWNGKTDWYYFDAEGYMVTGWITWEGNRYYLHPVSDNTQGHMYTGWQQIDGKWYYFRPESGGPQGSLFVNGTTPDGYTVDANGVWIQ